MTARELPTKSVDWKVVKDLGVPVVGCMLLLATVLWQNERMLDAQLATNASNSEALRQMVQIAAEIRAIEMRQDQSVTALERTLDKVWQSLQRHGDPASMVDGLGTK